MEEHSWLVGHFVELHEHLKKHVTPFFKETDVELFTLHDETHCLNVEKMIKAIVSRTAKGYGSLTETERFLLSCAAWTHDVGMNSKIARNYFIEIYGGEKDGLIEHRRKEHHNISSWYLSKESEELFGIKDKKEHPVYRKYVNIIRSVAAIIKYHRKSEDIVSCEDVRYVNDEKVRLKLISAIFRLADTLHKDVSRFDPNQYAMVTIASFDRTSRLHWLKSYFASNIYLDAKKQEIFIQLDCPDINLFTDMSVEKEISRNDREKKVNEWKNKINNLEYIIANDIDEDLYSVNDIFSSFGFPTYVKVRIQTSFSSGFKKQDCKGLEEILNDLDILFSPNTSKIIKRTLDSVELFSEMTHDNEKIFKRQFLALIGYLGEIKRNRPCHTGISKIIEHLVEIQDSSDRFENKKHKMACLVKKTKCYRKEAGSSISKYTSEIISSSTKAIFLIGFSSTVVQFLSKFAEENPDNKEAIEVFILECGSKRRLSHKSQIEYSDGIQFALEVGKLDFYKINIIPDVGFATILNLREHCTYENCDIQKSNYVMLIGANGISVEDNACGHTSGHLNTIVAAKHFNIPIVLLSDTFKVGKIEWDLNAKRNTHWLTAQRNHFEELRQCNVSVLNYREDKIDFGYLSAIISNAGIVRKEKSQSAFADVQLASLIKESKSFDGELRAIVNGED